LPWKKVPVRRTGAYRDSVTKSPANLKAYTIPYFTLSHPPSSFCLTAASLNKFTCP